MISLTPLIRHIKDGGAGFDGLWFRQVAGAAEYAQIRPDALPLPAAWVVRNADRIRHAGERAENVGMVFDVVIAIENARVHQAGETDDLLLKYRKKVKDLLLGWQIAPDVRPVNFEGGRVLEYTDADLYWADKYSFEALINNYLPDPGSFDKIVNTGDGL